jgi:hypothetical protein
MLDALRAQGIKFRSLTEHIDTETPAGRAMWQIIGVLAELVAYLLVADNVSGPLLTRLIDPSQPVIHTGNEFSRPRLALLASI